MRFGKLRIRELTPSIPEDTHNWVFERGQWTWTSLFPRYEWVTVVSNITREEAEDLLSYWFDPAEYHG